MRARYVRAEKKAGLQTITLNSLIERLRKIRALNCSPSDVGMDDYVWKSLFYTRSNIFSKNL